MLALLRITRHAGSDKFIIPMLVSMAGLSIAEKSLTAWNDRIRDKTQRASLLAELETFRTDGFFDVRDILATELAATKRTIESGQAYEVGDGQQVEVPPGERAAVIAEIERVFAAAEKAWPASDAESQIKRLIESARNPRSRVFVSGLDVFRRQCGKSQRELDAVIALYKTLSPPRPVRCTAWLPCPTKPPANRMGRR